MSNIINVKEERNVLEFDGEIFDIVANSTNFYLKFDLDEEWKACKIITVIFDFDGLKCHTELDENYMCQIPQTNSSKILFSLVAEPDEKSKLSSTILSLNVKASADDTRESVLVYNTSHANLIGLIQNLQLGKGISAEHSNTATNAEIADYAKVAGASETQVSLTGDETIAGVKNFSDKITHNLEIVPDATDISGWNYIINGNFTINQRMSSSYTREGVDIYTADKWGLFKGNGTFSPYTKKLTGSDETTPTVFCQWIEESSANLFGKTVTVSAYIDGVRRYKTIELDSSIISDKIENIYETEDYTFRLYIRRSQKFLGVQFLVNNGVTIKIERVKLEQSKFLTKYEERSIALEYMMCQRYFQRVRIFAVGYAVSEDKISFFVPYICTLRNAQKFYVSVNPSILINGEYVIPDNIVFHDGDAFGVSLYATGSGFTAKEPYFLVEGMLRIEGDYFF